MKSVEVTIRVLLEVDEDIVDIPNIDSQLVICFYKEDTYGTEHYLPKDDGLTVIDYLETRIESITEIV